MDRRRIDCIQALFALFTKAMDKQTDPEAVRVKLVAAIRVAGGWQVRAGEPVVLTASGAWTWVELTDAECVALTLELDPRLKRRLPAAAWKTKGKKAA